MLNFKEVYFIGDIHGAIPEAMLNTPHYPMDGDNFAAMIMLGDAGFNYYLDKRDHHFKHAVNYFAENHNIIYYILRGNHEERPEKIKGMERVFDLHTEQYVYLEEEFPFIKYLIDGQTYNFNNEKMLAIGGAYSVDKFYRLENNWAWFKDEQLTQEEMKLIFDNNKNEKFDFILSHTCPLSFQPTDLFMDYIDQATVDNSMERFLNVVSCEMDWKYWLFGHYHKSREQYPKVYMLSDDIVLTLSDILAGTVDIEKNPYYFKVCD